MSFSYSFYFSIQKFKIVSFNISLLCFVENIISVSVLKGMALYYGIWNEKILILKSLKFTHTCLNINLIKSLLFVIYIGVILLNQ